jgi:transketolase C-terminal domain/subunit
MRMDRGMAKKVYHNIGPMERAGILAAGGFGSEKGKQGIFSTFAAFIEMIVSELTMLRMGRKNLLLHFSHIGEDDMSDNTCHFGWNAFFLDNGPAADDGTRLYFGADAAQQDKIIKKVYGDSGIRAILSTRSAVPYIVDDSGKRIFGEGYKFEPGKDEEILSGKAGYVVAYGEMFYRALDAVYRARKDGIDVGIINKPTLNVVDEEMIAKIGTTPFVLLVESQNYNTGMGVRFADWLAKRDLKTNYKHMGATKPGIGGQSEQIPYQGLGPENILARIKEMTK